MSRDLVVEIGCEEIPARLMPETLARLKELAEDMLADKRLSFTEVKTVGTPRRLVLVARDLAEETAARVTEVKGPPAKAAYDASGQPTRAAEGFARSQGVELSALVVRTVDGGQYVFATKSEQGRPAQQVLARELPALIRSLSFPRPMRWGATENSNSSVLFGGCWPCLVLSRWSLNWMVSRAIAILTAIGFWLPDRFW